MPRFACTIIALLSLTGCSVPNYVHERTEKISIESQAADALSEAVPLASIDLSTFNGAIDVQPHDLPLVSMQVTYRAYGDSEEQAEHNARAMHCEYAIENQSLSITATKPHGQWRASAAFELLVPRDLELRLQTSNGSVQVSGIDAPVHIDTSNGSIVTTNVGDVRAKSSNGAIKVVHARGAIDLRTSNGRIEYSGQLSGSGNRIQTSNGRVVLLADPEQAIDVDATTSNGSIKCSIANQRVISESKKHFHAVVGGNSLAPAAQLLIKTSNGSVSIDPMPTEAESVEAEIESKQSIAL